MKKVLVLEDEVSIRSFVVINLRRAGYEPFEAGTGKEALDQLQNKPDIGVAIFDINLPDMDGFETITAIRENDEWKKIPVIFLTGNNDAATEIKCFEYGALDFITKPFVKEIALHRIESQLKLAEYSASLEEAVEERTRELLEAMAEKQRVTSELAMATEIQKSMLPSTFPAFPERRDFDIHAYIDTALEVGGDFYNFRMLDDDHLMMVIADVVGKGIPAALFMVKVTTLMTAVSKSHLKASEIVSTTNDLISENNDEDLFTTAFVAVCELSTGKLSYSSAGHNPPVLVREGEDAMFLDCTPNMVLGPMAGMPYEEGTITLKKNDVFFLYTDGVDEAMNRQKEQYGPDRLLSVLSGITPAESAKSIIDKVNRDVKEFVCGETQSDDITMLSFIYKA